MSDFKFESVADDFDAYVRGQLPWYDLATTMVAEIVRAYAPRNGDIYDVGCATGNIGRALHGLVEERGLYLRGFDTSAAMIRVATNFPAYMTVEPRHVQGVDFKPCDVIVSFLTMMFVPPADRPAVFAKMMAALRPGGVLILFERFESAPGYLGLTLQRLGWAAKLAQGVSSEDIVAKELSLSGVQRPLSYDEVPGPNPLRVFQYGDFAGFVSAAA